MRRSRRFRRIFRRVNIFIVVFVAFVNACFFCPFDSLAANLNFSDFINSSYLGSNFGTIYDPTEGGSISGSSVTFNVVANDSSGVVVDGSTTENISRYDFDLQLSVFNNVLKSDYSDYFEDGFAHVSGYIQASINVYFEPFQRDGSRISLDGSELILLDTNYSPFNLRVLEYKVSGDSNYGLALNFIISFNNVEFTNILDYLNFLTLTFHFTGVTSQSTYYCPVTVEVSSFNSGGYVYPGPASGSSSDLAVGFDDSAGNQVASDFESGAASYDQAEDNLFNSADSALTGFKFFDFSTFGTITTGLSFVSGIMTSIYNNFGAMQGLGIVLSVLFSVMFMAIVIGFYRYFK